MNERWSLILHRREVLETSAEFPSVTHYKDRNVSGDQQEPQSTSRGFLLTALHVVSFQKFRNFADKIGRPQGEVFLLDFYLQRTPSWRWRVHTSPLTYRSSSPCWMVCLCSVYFPNVVLWKADHHTNHLRPKIYFLFSLGVGKTVPFRLVYRRRMRIWIGRSDSLIHWINARTHTSLGADSLSRHVLIVIIISHTVMFAWR